MTVRVILGTVAVGICALATGIYWPSPIRSTGLAVQSPAMTSANAIEAQTPPSEPVKPMQTGLASFYDEPQKTATGETFNPEALTAAHKSLPLGSHVKVTSLESGKTVEVRINDRGPYVEKRVIDLSKKAAETIGIDKEKGVASVELTAGEK